MPSRRALLRATASATLAGALAGCVTSEGGPEAAEWRASAAGSGRLTRPVVSRRAVASSGRLEDGDEGRVDAFDPDTGERLWRSGIEEPTGLAVDGERVYAGRRRPGRVLAFDVESGDREWTAGVRNRASSIAPAGETVYVANGSLAAIDATDGTVRWEREGVDDVDFTVTVAPSDLLAATRDGVFFADDTGVVALSPADGSVRWRWRADGEGSDGWEWTTAGPYPHDDRIYVGDSERGRIAAIDADTGEPAWERTLRGAEVVVGFHAQNRDLVVATRTSPSTDAGAGTVHVLDRRDGTPRRTISLEAPPTDAASRADRFVLALDEGTVVGLDVGWDEPELWRASLPGNESAVATDGATGYALDGEGTLWALDEP